MVPVELVGCTPVGLQALKFLSVFDLPTPIEDYINISAKMATRLVRLHQAMITRATEKEATLTTGLVVVLREQPCIAALQHIVHALDDLVDVSWQCNIARACALESEDASNSGGGARRLVARMVARQPLAEMDTFYRQAQLMTGLVNAAERGNTELVQWLLTNIVSERFTVDSHSGIFKAADVAASNGHLHILEQILMHDKGGVSVMPAMLSAARGNKVDTLKWLSKRLVPPANLNDCASSLLEAAAGNGSVEIVAWLVEMVGEDGMRQAVPNAAQSAISGGHFTILRSLVDIASSIDRALCLDEAAGKGYFQAVRWGLERGGMCTTKAMDTAAGNGHLEIVEWLHDHQEGACTTLALDNAASHGHLNVVRWLHENRGEGCTAGAMDRAARHGHIDVVKWLHKHREEGCTTAAMNGAARGGYLDVIQWLHDHRSEGCTQEAIDGAACNGNVAVMRWLITHRSADCRVSHSALANAAANGQLNAVQWLYKNLSGNSTSEWIACDAMDRAASGGHLNIVRWLHERRPEIGSCTTAALDSAASNGHLQMVKWLHANRQEGGTYRAMDGAAAGGHLEVMMFLHSHRSDGCTSDAAVNAALNEHVEVVQWLLQRYPQQTCHKKVRKFATKYNFSLLDRFNRRCILPVGVY